MHIFCNAAFRSVTLHPFLLRIAAGPELVMRYITGKMGGMGNELRSATHYITGFIVLRLEFAIIYAQMVF